MSSGIRQVAVITVGRSDFGRYLPVLRLLRSNNRVELRIIASGGHFSSAFGNTVQEIEEHGFTWEPGFDEEIVADKPENVGHIIGIGTSRLAKAFAANRPDVVVVLGDRFEMLSAANAALGFNIPVFHIHGGAVTEGAIDELVRHALTKMSHLHMVSCEKYAARLRQMGEEDWRVHVTGAPVLDDLTSQATLDRKKLSEYIGLDLSKPTLLMCFHAVTVEPGRAKSHIESLLEGLRRTDIQVVMTYPNVDPGFSPIVKGIEVHAQQFPFTVRLLKNAGSDIFVSLLDNVDALIGNSSTGIVEAASFKLPVVNIGTRQDGKIKPANVIDTDYNCESIEAGLSKALDPKFRKSISGLVNPYGDGKSGPRVANIIVSQPLNERLLRKKFIDSPYFHEML